MKESKFQANLIQRIREELPGCEIIKQDAQYIQGIPDWIILYRDKWAMLECKESAHAKTRPNQPYYVNLFNKMSFARFVWPENEEEVVEDLMLYLKGE
jgi:hypothetical protein|nr:MAG TPA: hydrolase [Caudoviricetes sp.]